MKMRVKIKIAVMAVLLFAITAGVQGAGSRAGVLRVSGMLMEVPAPPWISAPENMNMVSGGVVGAVRFLANPLAPGTHLYWAGYWLAHRPQ